MGFAVVYLFLPNLSQAVLGAALAAGAGGFLYLAHLSFAEARWPLAQSVALAALGVLLIAAVRSQRRLPPRLPFSRPRRHEGAEG